MHVCARASLPPATRSRDRAVVLRHGRVHAHAARTAWTGTPKTVRKRRDVACRAGEAGGCGTRAREERRSAAWGGEERDGGAPDDADGLLQCAKLSQR